MNSDHEQWKWAKGFEGMYLVSNRGTVKSVARQILMRGVLAKRPEFVLSPRVVGAGYLQVVLQRNKMRTTRYVHALVAELFCDRPEGTTEVNHEDLDKTNNSAGNLVWTTRLGNMRHGRTNFPYGVRGNRKEQRRLIISKLSAKAA